MKVLAQSRPLAGTRFVHLAYGSASAPVLENKRQIAEGLSGMSLVLLATAVGVMALRRKVALVWLAASVFGAGVGGAFLLFSVIW